MMDLSTKTCCVIDNGLFTELARTLGKSFGTVYYLSSWETSFPRSNSLIVGEGVEGVTKITSIWPVLDKIDLFVFPDIFHGPLQVYLRSIGKRVWGSGLAESLEFRRANSKRWLQQLGLPVGPYRPIKGMHELRRHLMTHPNVYVKSETRGDMETFHSKEYGLIEPRLDELQHHLGAKGHDYEFIVEEPIETDREVGYDGFSIDGRFPKESLYGIEVKDTGYVGQVKPYTDMPEELRFVNRKLSPLFKELQYRGFWSSEIRVGDKPYLIDPCCRMASPPGELYQFMIGNLAEVIWHGADGDLVEPEWTHKWGALIVLKSEWAESGWQPLEIPQGVRDQVKVHYLTERKGYAYCVPQQIPIPEIAAVVAGGDTPQAAIKEVTKVAEQVRGYDLHFDAPALKKALEGMF